MKLDRTFLSVIADLCVNLAAGWIGAVIIVPNFTEDSGKRKLFVLCSDVVLAILCIVIALFLRGSI